MNRSRVPSPDRPQLVFHTVDEAVSVLGRYTTQTRLEAVKALGYDLSLYTHKELAGFVCASREKVTAAIGRMSKPKKS